MSTPEERRRIARIGGLTTAARHGGSAMTRAAREARYAKYEREVDPDGVLDPQERARRASCAERADMTRMAHLSAKSRRKQKPAQEETAAS